MARMVPDVDPEQITLQPERLVYIALAKLPAPYVVMHSYPWLRPMRYRASEPLKEGEADFLILHPERGLLVLEVKGGQPELRNRIWYRSGEEMRDPFEQARKSRYALLEAVEERTRGRIDRSLFTHGDVVVFPHCVYDGDLPMNAEPRIVLDARDLDCIEPRIEEAFEAWARASTSLSHVQFTALLDALLPKLRLLRCVGAEIQGEGARILQMTEQQQATLLGLRMNDRVLVEGVAGSGKTLLAIDFAVTLAAEGLRTLFLCFNRQLASWIEEQVASDPRLGGARREALEISTFHSMAFRLARQADVQFDVPTEHEPRFWDEEVPLILEQAIELLRARPNPPLFDAVVVDEAQDFFRDWWVTVESLTKEGARGKLYAFLDVQQSLRGTGEPPPVAFPTRFPLSMNCRNTKAIAQSAARFSGVSVRVYPMAPDGEPPGVIRAPGAPAQTGLVLAELRRLIRSGVTAKQIAVIGPAARDRGGLGAVGAVDDVPFTSDATEWRRGRGILVTTARAFKGLEADVVVLYDLSGFGPHFTRTDLYVAWTRARHRLIAVCIGAEVRAEIEAASAQRS